MSNLNDRTWKPFFIEQIAEIVSGRDIYEDERISGDTPYVSSSSVNNGVCHFVGNVNETLEDRYISVNRNGSVGYAFYHPYKSLISNDCRKIRLFHNNKYVALFICVQITSQRMKYNYGYKMGTSRIKRQIILLPVDEKGSPDYEFMERYVKEHETRVLKQYCNYVRNAMKQLKNNDVIPTLNDVEWKPFKLTDLFEIKPGKRLTKAEMTPGNVPFLGASEANNGITAFVGNSNESEDSNVLGVNYNGSVVANFYHPYRCLFSDDVKRFKLKGREGNKYVYLFLKIALLQQKIKYSYGYKFNESRMNKQKILLPIDDDGKPDFDYMERYVKNVVVSKYRQFLSYKEIELK